MFDELGCPGVNLEPRERIAKDVAMGDRALRARAGSNIVQPSLQTKNLAQPLDVAPRQRQLAEPRTSSASLSPLRDGLTTSAKASAVRRSFMRRRKAVPYNRRLSGLP